MKNLLILAALAASTLLAACGGGEPVTVTQVPVSVMATPSEAPAAVPSQPLPLPAVLAPIYATPIPPIVLPTTPTAPTYTYGQLAPDIVLTNVPVNVAKRTINIGQQGVNLLAFTAAITSLDKEASLQQLVFQDMNGNDLDQLFSRFRIADANGDICPIFNCYPQVNGTRVRISFVFGWRPSGGELGAYALQADTRPDAATNTTIALKLIGVQTREWGVLVESDVYGREIETTAIIAPPAVTSPQGRQIVGATPGSQYEILPVSVTCSAKATQGCWLASIPLYAENATDLQVNGTSASNPVQGSRDFAVPVNYFMRPGETVTWTVTGTATGSTIYTQWWDMTFTVDGVTLSPVNANPSSECVVASGAAGCFMGGKG